MSQQLEVEPQPPVTVTIFDQPYRLRSGRGGDEHVRRVASLVDERMREVAAHARSLDMTRIAVLAALNIADELESLRADQAHDELAHAALSRDDARDNDLGREPHDEAVLAELTDAHTDSPDAAERRETQRDAGSSRRSWFEEIFEAEEEPDEARDNARRLSAEISSKLRPRRRD